MFWPNTAIAAIAILMAMRFQPALGVQMKLIPAPFNATAYQTLIDCVRNVSSKYSIGIDQGTVVILPAEGEVLSEAEMRQLDDCLTSALHCATDGDRSIVTTDGVPWRTLDEADAQWAEANGAEGLVAVPKNETASFAVVESAANGNNTQSNARAQLTRRQRIPSYYYAYGSDEKDCSSADSQATVYKECISHANSYRSISFGNVDLYNTLVVMSWPHHLCARDYGGQGVRRTKVPAASDSACVQKTTFSYEGDYINSCADICA